MSYSVQNYKRYVPLFLYLIFLILFEIYCTPSNLKSGSSFFESCMETFKDEQKCAQMITKMDNPGILKKKIDSAHQQNLFIRNELKDLLDTKSKSFVLETLGEPEEKYTDGSGREFFKYTRPISRYSPNHDPDIEIIIILKRNFVSKVVHKKPESTP